MKRTILIASLVLALLPAQGNARTFHFHAHPLYFASSFGGVTQSVDDNHFGEPSQAPVITPPEYTIMPPTGEIGCHRTIERGGEFTVTRC